MRLPDRQIDLICNAVAEETGCDAAVIRKRRPGAMAKEMRLAMFVCRELTGLEPKEIGVAFGTGRVDALRAIFQSDYQRGEDAAFAALVASIKARAQQDRS